MLPVDLLQLLRKRPFEPFRILVSDGITYDIRHPELVMVGVGAVLIGVPAASQTQPVYERYETISLGHIVKLTPVSGQASGAASA